MNVNNYNLDDITWDTFVEDYKFVHDRLYRNLDIKTSRLKAMESIWEAYLSRVTNLYSRLLEPYYNKNCKLPQNVADVYSCIFCEINLNRTSLHEIVVKLRDCKDFEEYKKVVENDGLGLISDMVHKRTLKRIMDKELIRSYQNKVTYIMSLTLFPMYVNRGVLPSNLDDIISKELRYDYIAYGYPLFESPIMAQALLSDYSYNINEYIDKEVSRNHKFPKDAEMSVEFHKVLVAGSVTSLSHYSERYDTISIMCNKILNYFDRFTMVATDYIDSIINDLKDSIEIDINGFLNDLVPTVNQCTTREEMIENVINLENKYLLQDEILHNIVDKCDDIFKIIGIYAVSLSNLGIRTKMLDDITYRCQYLNSSDRKEVLDTCEHLFEFKGFILEYLLHATFNITIHADRNLNEYIIDVINKQCELLNLDNSIDTEDILESNIVEDLEIKFRDKYQELNSIAKEHGFDKIRQKGDHGIFRRNDGSTIVIPQGRKIGKGLSLKIQKDIKSV